MESARLHPDDNKSPTESAESQEFLARSNRSAVAALPATAGVMAGVHLLLAVAFTSAPIGDDPTRTRWADWLLWLHLGQGVLVAAAGAWARWIWKAEGDPDASRARKFVFWLSWSYMVWAGAVSGVHQWRDLPPAAFLGVTILIAITTVHGTRSQVALVGSGLLAAIIGVGVGQEDAERRLAVLVQCVLIAGFGVVLARISMRERRDTYHLSRIVERQTTALTRQNADLYAAVERRRDAELELQRLADHDPLTGLVNRRVFHAAVQALAETKTCGAVLIVNIDCFKQINDTQGHPFGDRVLSGVGEVLAAKSRRADVIGRLGGDEFGIVVADLPAERVAALAAELRASVRGSERFPEIAPLEISIGVALLEAGDSSASLLNRADISLFADKIRAGRRREREPGEG